MSQPGAAHGDKKASGASATSEENKAEAAEKKPGSANVGQPPKTQASGAPPAAKKQPPTVDPPRTQIMKSSDTKPTPTTEAEPTDPAESAKLAETQGTQPPEEEQKEPSDAKSQGSPSETTDSKPNNAGKETASQAGQPQPASSMETAKPKPEMSVAAGPAGASMVALADQPSIEAAMDELALDSLIDTLGGPEDVPLSPAYTGPEITEDISSRYLEEMGIREGSLPPEYVKLLKGKGDGKEGVPPKVDEGIEKPMTDDELVKVLSTDFTCVAASPGGKEASPTETPIQEGEIMQAQAVTSVKTSVPAKEEKAMSQEEIKEIAVSALLDTLGGPEPEPEKDLTPVVEVSEVKAKEKKEEKAGERDDTIPPEYRLTPELDKDGKPILPKPEEKPKPLSESHLADEFSKDFDRPAQPAVQDQPLKPGSTANKSPAPECAKPAAEEAVPRVAACTVQSAAPPSASSVGHGGDEALEALSASLGQREPDPEEKKPVVEQVKEQTKQEELKKLGEDEETIPPEYRLTGAKDKDGKPLLPKPEEESQPLSEKDLLEALTEGFSSSPSPSVPLPAPAETKKSKEGGKPEDSSEVISAATVSSVHSSAPAAAASGGEEIEEALDLLSESLGQREPDPDEDKPVVDKVKEKAESEHRDKLGEREDTIPPDYRKLLESGQQGKPGKATAKSDTKRKEPQEPQGASAAVEALSGDFDTRAKSPAAAQRSKDKSGKETIITKPTPRDKGKAKDSKKGKGRSSGGKSEKQKAN